MRLLQKVAGYLNSKFCRILLVFALVFNGLLPISPSPVKAANTPLSITIDGATYNIRNLGIDGQLSGTGWKYTKKDNRLTLDNFNSNHGISVSNDTLSGPPLLNIHLKGQSQNRIFSSKKTALNNIHGNIKITADNPEAELSIVSQLDGSEDDSLITCGGYFQEGGLLKISHRLLGAMQGNLIIFDVLELTPNLISNDARLTINAQSDYTYTFSGFRTRIASEVAMRTSRGVKIVIGKPSASYVLPSEPKDAVAFSNHKLKLGSTGTYEFETLSDYVMRGHVTLEDSQRLVDPNIPDFVSGYIPSHVKPTGKKLLFKHVSAPQQLNLNCGTGGQCTKTPNQTSYPTGTNVKVKAEANTGYYIETFKINSVTESEAIGADVYEKQLVMDGNKTVEVTFKKNNYNLSLAVSDPNGTVTPSSTYPEYQEEVTFTVNPNPGYRLKSLTYQPVSGVEQDITDTLKFIMPAENTMYSYEFELIPSSYNVTIDSSITHGVVTATPNNAPAGTEIQVATTPDSGYRLKAGSLKANGVQIVDNKFIMPNQDVIITAEFELILTNYNVTVDSSITHGSVTVNPTIATAGIEIQVTINPNPGYRLKVGSLKANGMPIVGNKFTMPNQDVIVTAEFEPILPTTYTITVTDGTATPTSAIAGTAINLVADPAPVGQIFDKWTTTTPGVVFNDPNDPTTSFVMLATNVHVTATYKIKPTINLTVNCGMQGVCTTTPTGTNFPTGSLVKVDVGAYEGYVIDEFSINGVTVPVATNKISYEHTLALTSDTTVAVSFKKGYYNIVPTGIFVHGTVVPNPVFAEFQQEVIFTVTPAIGYRLKKLTYVRSGTSATPIDISTVKKLNMPGYDIDYYAEFELIPTTTYTITVVDGTATPNSAPAGTTINLVANPAPIGQIFSKWIADTPGLILVDANNPITRFTMPASNVKIMASYKAKTSTQVNNSTTGSTQVSSQPRSSNDLNTSSDGSQALTQSKDIGNENKSLLRLDYEINKTNIQQNESFVLKVKSLEPISIDRTIEIWLNSTKLGDINVNDKDWQSKEFSISCEIPASAHMLKARYNGETLLDIPLTIKSNPDCLASNESSKSNDVKETKKNKTLALIFMPVSVILSILGLYALNERKKK